MLEGVGINTPALKNTGNAIEFGDSAEILSLYIIILFIPIESNICHAI
jgi:hypothetical protein